MLKIQHKIKRPPMKTRLLLTSLVFLTGGALNIKSACCYFSAKNNDILQPAQKVFITWDPAEKVETFTVQPKFEGNAHDFGMVIPTPRKPKLDEMPRDFFKDLAVFTILKKRDGPQSKLLPHDLDVRQAAGGQAGGGRSARLPTARRQRSTCWKPASSARSTTRSSRPRRADDLFQWLKDNKYSYAGDEATLDYYIKKKWLFTVMKIDTMQMKQNAGRHLRRRSHAHPLPVHQRASSSTRSRSRNLSVKDKTEALFYVQAPDKVDLPGDMTYQPVFIPMWRTALTFAVPEKVTDRKRPGRTSPATSPPTSRGGSAEARPADPVARPHEAPQHPRIRRSTRTPDKSARLPRMGPNAHRRRHRRPRRRQSIQPRRPAGRHRQTQAAQGPHPRGPVHHQNPQGLQQG